MHSLLANNNQGNFVSTNSKGEKNTLEVGRFGPAKEDGKNIDSRISGNGNHYTIPVWEGAVQNYTYNPTKDQWSWDYDGETDGVRTFIRVK